MTFGLENQADIKGDFVQNDLLICVGNETETIQLALLGRHNALNALAASAAALAVGQDLLTIKQGLESLQAVKGRLAPVAGIQGSLVIDDSYNANPDSARVAIDVLAKSTPSKRIFVLGDMAELGVNTAQAHREIGDYANAQGIDTLYCLGTHSKQACVSFGCNGFHFDAIAPLLEALEQDIKQQQGKQVGDEYNVTILVKGSRSMKMERVVERLARKNNDGRCHDGTKVKQEATLC
jgi:UDP-N-acetylmuramoyl-tripeptide--D-alanyl-D-alanine ligase